MNINYELITFMLTIGAVIFAVYNYFRNPQELIEKKQAVSEIETQSNAKMLSEKVKWEKESTQEKFKEMALRLDSAFTLAQNHVHTVDTKVDNLIATTNAWHLEISNKLSILQTVIEERMPKK